MSFKKSEYILFTVFIIITIAVILSLETTAKPEYNDEDTRKVPGCYEISCHEITAVNDRENEPNLHINIYTAMQARDISIVFFTDNTEMSEKLEYEWNENSQKWDEPIMIAAELTEAKEGDQAIVYDSEIGEGPKLTLFAPDGGTYWVNAGYYNRTSEIRVWTKVEIEVPYKNSRPTARAVFDGIDKGELISNYGKTGDSSDDYPEKTAIFRFDKDGLGRLFFKADCTDTDWGDEDNLTYFWDFNNQIDDDENGVYTNDNDTTSEGGNDRIFYTFYQANHENEWEDNVDRTGQIFEPNEPYVINLSVTDNHLNRAWNWANLNVMFHAPKTYPDLQILDARFKEIDDDEDGFFEIGESMTVEINIENTGKNSTGWTPFRLKFEDQNGKKIIPDYEYNNNIEAQSKKTITFPWTGTTLWADGVTTPLSINEYNVTIEIAQYLT